jgi:Xaa-Pro dipeptidase
MSELALKRLIEGAMWSGGAEAVDYVLVQAGPNSSSPHHSGDATIFAAGEPVLVDISVRVDGYYADITQQVFLGTPTAEYAERYAVVREAQRAGVAAAQPGAPVMAVAEAASAVITDAGFAEWSGPRTGHGIGLDVHEPPSVVEGVPTELVPGTAITVEPGLYEPGRFGIRIEDTVLVTAEGPRCVTRGSRPLCAR